MNFFCGSYIAPLFSFVFKLQETFKPPIDLCSLLILNKFIYTFYREVCGKEKDNRTRILHHST